MAQDAAGNAIGSCARMLFITESQESKLMHLSSCKDS